MSLKLRCPLANTMSVTITAPTGGYTAGQMTKIGDLVGVVVEGQGENGAAVLGEEVALIYKAEKIMLPCATVTTGTYTQGSKVYFDAGDGEVNQSASGNTLCGHVLEQPEIGDTEVLCELDGTLAV